jgi:hypothetical protein
MKDKRKIFAILLVVLTILITVIIGIFACKPKEKANSFDITPTLTTSTLTTKQPLTTITTLTTVKPTTTISTPATIPITQTSTIPSTTTPTPTPEVKSVKLTDPPDDLFDASGNPIKDQPYLDIVEIEVTISGSDYILRIKLNGPLPAKTPDSQLFLEWDIYVDADNNPSTGSPWTIVTNDIGPEYFARLMLLDSNYSSEVLEFKTGKSQKIENKITDTTIELRWPQSFSQTDTFNFVVAAKKYGKRGAGNAFMLADKAPNLLHANFPTGEVLDTDKDGFTDEEEVSIMKTDPKVAEQWADLNTVTGILNTPKKVSVYLERKFKSVPRPSTPFATTVTELFKEMYGDCDEYAILAIYWLAKNGYESYMLKVDFNKWWQEYNTWLSHDICVYQEKDGSWYSIDLYFHGSGHNPVGPFKSINEICAQLPSHYGATDWTNYKLFDGTGELVQTVTK